MNLEFTVKVKGIYKESEKVQFNADRRAASCELRDYLLLLLGPILTGFILPSPS